MNAAVPWAAGSDRPPGNPFATRFTRPGMIPPLDAAGRPLDLQRLAATARRLGRSALEGPHGRGKSTVLHALARELSAAGVVVEAVRVRGPRHAAAALCVLATAPRGAMIVVDGWERLGRSGALLARLLARWRALGLVVTAHGRTGLPVLARCESTPELLAAIVDRLPSHRGLIDPQDVVDAHRRHDGDLREALYDLYDRFERRSR